MEIKIMTLNIARFQRWLERKQKLINFIKSENPDIILLQEVCEDNIDYAFANQAEELNKSLNYSFCSYERVTEIKKLYKAEDNGGFMGLAVLSKFPILSSELKMLKFYPENKDKKQQSNQVVSVNLNNKKISIINVHFENNDKSSKLQLKETIDYCKKNHLSSIIAGDFNMIITSDVKEIAGRDYWISYELKKYISFPPNQFSNNRVDITLDYILADKQKFKFDSIKCGPKNLSDHIPVLAEVAFE